MTFVSFRNVILWCVSLGWGSALQGQAAVVDDTIVTVPYESTHAPSARAVLLEAETWVDCHPCRHRDLVTDAVLHRYRRDQVVVLLHHYNPPLLAADEPSDSAHLYLSRSAYYTRVHQLTERTRYRSVEVYVNGTVPNWGQDIILAPSQVLYDSTVAAIDAQLRIAPEARLSVTALAEGTRHVMVRVGIDSVVASPTADTRLHVVLVEDSVLFTGRNHVAVHRMVWRAEGHERGEAGYTVRPGSPATVHVQFDLADIAMRARTRNMADWARLWSKFEAERHWAPRTVPSTVFIPVMQHLGVVVFLQENATGHILQAAYQPVSPQSEGSR